MAQSETGALPTSEKLTLGEYLEKWLGDVVAHSVTPKTLDGYRRIIRLHLAPGLGLVRLKYLSALHIQQYYGKALATGNTRGGVLSPQSVLHHHRVLFTALEYATVEMQLLQRNPCAAVKPPRVTRKRPRVLSLVEVRHFLASLQGSSLYMPALLAVATGMRQAEILALRWKEVDLDAGKINLSRSVSWTKETGLYSKGTKTDTGRVIALPSFAVEALQEHGERQGQDRREAGDRWQEFGLVCPRSDGSPDANPAVFANRFRRKMLRLGIDVTFHGLRHTHATLALDMGIHPKVVQERLGHSRIGTTLDLYSQVVQGIQDSAAEEIDRAFRRGVTNL